MNYLSIINNANHKYQIKDPELNKTKQKTKTVEKNSMETLHKPCKGCKGKGFFLYEGRLIPNSK